MANITIGRYPVPTADEREQVGEGVGFPADRWESYIEPEDKSWILFVPAKAGEAPAFFPKRDADGGVITDSE